MCIFMVCSRAASISIFGTAAYRFLHLHAMYMSFVKQHGLNYITLMTFCGVLHSSSTQRKCKNGLRICCITCKLKKEFCSLRSQIGCVACFARRGCALRVPGPLKAAKNPGGGGRGWSGSDQIGLTADQPLLAGRAGRQMVEIC